MPGFRAFFSKEVVEWIRTGRWFFLAISFLVLGIAVPLAFRFLPQFAPPGLEPLLGQLLPSSATEVIANTFKNLSQLGILILVLVSMGTVAHEASHGQLELVFSKPVGRAALLLAKWSAYFLSFLVALTISLLANYFYTAALFPPPPPALQYWMGGGLFFLYGLFVYSLTLLASVLFRSQWAAISSLAFLILLSFLPPFLPSWAHLLPSGLLQSAALIAQGSFSPVFAADEILVTILSMLFLLLLALLALRRKEL